MPGPSWMCGKATLRSAICLDHLLAQKELTLLYATVVTSTCKFGLEGTGKAELASLLLGQQAQVLPLSMNLSGPTLKLSPVSSLSRQGRPSFHWGRKRACSSDSASFSDSFSSCPASHYKRRMAMNGVAIRTGEVSEVHTAHPF